MQNDQLLLLKIAFYNIPFYPSRNVNQMFSLHNPKLKSFPKSGILATIENAFPASGPRDSPEIAWRQFLHLPESVEENLSLNYLYGAYLAQRPETLCAQRYFKQHCVFLPTTSSEILYCLSHLHTMLFRLTSNNKKKGRGEKRVLRFRRKEGATTLFAFAFLPSEQLRKWVLRNVLALLLLLLLRDVV